MTAVGTGVKPIIIELDVIIDTPLPNTLAKLDTMVADGYKQFLDVCFAVYNSHMLLVRYS